MKPLDSWVITLRQWAGPLGSHLRAEEDPASGNLLIAEAHLLDLANDIEAELSSHRGFVDQKEKE